jgi:putative membrane protein
MRTFTNIALLLATGSILSCSAARNSTGPTGPVTPSSGSASNISSGRNIGAAIGSGDEAVNPATVKDNGTIKNPDSLLNKLDKVPKQEKPMQFINEATMNGVAEVRLSQLALTKANNENIKAFSTLVIKDYAAANTEIKSLAAAKSLSLDSTKNNEDFDQQVTQLTTVSGEEFENLYIQVMNRNHEQALRLFEEGSRSDDAQVKAYAKKYLPLIKTHLQTLSVLMPK